jgi:hypothetical protein
MKLVYFPEGSTMTARMAADLLHPAPVFICRPQVAAMEAGRIVGYDKRGDSDEPGHGLLMTWLYRMGEDAPAEALVRLSSGALLRFGQSWVHSARNIAPIVLTTRWQGRRAVA